MSKHGGGLKVSAAVLVCSMLLSGCDEADKTSELRRWVNQERERPADPIEPIPAVRTYSPYIYEGSEFRDPFLSTTSESSAPQVSGEDGPRPDANRVREYLERFELDTLQMVGTFAKGQQDWVLIRDPDNVVHRVAIGNYLGKNHGRVVAVQPDRVELAELVEDGIGGWTARNSSMVLVEE